MRRLILVSGSAALVVLSNFSLYADDLDLDSVRNTRRKRTKSIPLIWRRKLRNPLVQLGVAGQRSFVHRFMVIMLPTPPMNRDST